MWNGWNRLLASSNEQIDSKYFLFYSHKLITNAFRRSLAATRWCVCEGRGFVACYSYRVDAVSRKLGAITGTSWKAFWSTISGAAPSSAGRTTFSFVVTTLLSSQIIV